MPIPDTIPVIGASWNDALFVIFAGCAIAFVGGLFAKPRKG